VQASPSEGSSDNKILIAPNAIMQVSIQIRKAFFENKCFIVMDFL